MMRITHSTGCNNLDPVILSSHLDQLAIPLTEIFNSSFATGIVPQSLKMAKVTPIFKQGSRTLASNYRPISVLSYFAKIMEKIMHDRLNNYIVQNNFLHPLQHGFRSGHSTEMALMNLGETWRS